MIVSLAESTEGHIYQRGTADQIRCRRRFRPRAAAASFDVTDVEHTLSKSHLLPSELGQVVHRGATVEIDLEVHAGEIGRRAASEKRRQLLR